MRIKYLVAEDRQNLRLLRHTTDKDVIRAVLASLFKRKFTLQALWEYRKWIMELTEEELENNPELAYGRVQILILSGDLEGARLAAERMADGPYKNMCLLTIPGMDGETVREVLEKMDAVATEYGALTLTAGRPFTANGTWDISEFAPVFLEQPERATKHLQKFYGEEGEKIYDLMCAEFLYQRDECYQALVRIVSTLPYLRAKKNVRLLFAALATEAFVLVINGQAAAAGPMLDNLRNQFAEAGLEAYWPNADAMAAWAAMYDGDYAHVARWLREDGPDEHSNFCMLDIFRYMIKIRAYLIYGKDLAIMALSQRLLPLLEAGHRYMDSCELHLLTAMSHQAEGRTAEALAHMEQVLMLSEKYGYYRLIADEGKRAWELLRLYKKEVGTSTHLERLLAMTEKTVSLHPRYLSSHSPEKPRLTPSENRVLHLLAQQYTNAQIAEQTDTAVETVKKHCKHICAKLGAKTRHQAVSRAAELGMLPPDR